MEAKWATSWFSQYLPRTMKQNNKERYTVAILAGTSKDLQTKEIWNTCRVILTRCLSRTYRNLISTTICLTQPWNTEKQTKVIKTTCLLASKMKRIKAPKLFLCTWFKSKKTETRPKLMQERIINPSTLGKYLEWCVLKLQVKIMR